MTGREAGLRIESLSTPTLTSTKSAEAISPLRRRIIEDMNSASSASRLAAIISAASRALPSSGASPDTAIAEGLRRYQVHQKAEFTRRR
jgi:hypothetical protein